MKNQYFGDINDYRKYGLLRALQSNGDRRLLVAWMLTHDDGGRDGGFRAYLDDPDTWARYDPDLHAGLAGLLGSASQPAVSLIESTGLLPRASYHSMVVPDERRERDVWREHLLRAASSAELVFVDPDNGIEVPSRPVGRKGSSKYVTWSEIKALWKLDPDLPALPTRGSRVLRIANGVGVTTSHQRALGGGTSHPACPFLAGGSRETQAHVRDSVSIIQQRWNGQIEPMGLANNRLQRTVRCAPRR